MEKKIIGIFVCMIVIFAVILPVAGKINLNSNELKNNDDNSNNNSPLTLQGNHCLWSGDDSNLQNFATTPVFDFSSLISCELIFWEQYEIYDPDLSHIQVSLDGTTWTTIYSINGYVPHWTKKTIDLFMYVGRPYVQIRFFYETGVSSESNGWHIDDVTLETDVGTMYFTDFESGTPPGWILDGWTIVEKYAPPTTKYEQLPDTNNTGIDICVDRLDGEYERMTADDFECTRPGFITEITIWGSWLNNEIGEIEKLHLSIHKDIPADLSPTGYSMPGALLWYKNFSGEEFNQDNLINDDVLEWWWDPYTDHFGGDNNIYQYDLNIPLDEAFYQNGTDQIPVIYWLDVYVISNNGYYGWKTSFNHWNDDAVYYVPVSPYWKELRYPPGHEMEGKSIDMAFRITTFKPNCCFEQTWPDVPRFFLGRFKIRVKNICDKTFNDNTVKITWTVKNTGPTTSLYPNMIVRFPSDPTYYTLPPFIAPNWITVTKTYTFSGSWAPSTTKIIESPTLLGLFWRDFDITLRIDNCPPETHHGQMIFLIFGKYWR